MCWSVFACIAYAVTCISWRAMRSFSQGFGPMPAQPPTSDAASRQRDALLIRPIVKIAITSVRPFVEQSVDIGEIGPGAVLEEPAVHVAHAAITPDQDGGRHVLEVVCT